MSRKIEARLPEIGRFGIANDSRSSTARWMVRLQGLTRSVLDPALRQRLTAVQLSQIFLLLFQVTKRHTS